MEITRYFQLTCGYRAVRIQRDVVLPHPTPAELLVNVA